MAKKVAAKTAKAEKTTAAQNIHIRIDNATRAAWEAAAEADGRTLSGWIRACCQKNMNSQNS